MTQERGGAPLHFVLAWGVAHLGFGLGGLRFVSAFFAVASLPLVAALALRLGGTRAVALLATALVAPSWLFLFHGVYGRMYSLFLCCSLVCSLALLAALERGGRGRWALWVVAALVTVAAHPYAVLLLAGQGAYVLVARRDRLREAAVAGAVVLVVGVPFWLTDLVLVDRFEVGVGGGGEKLGGPGAVARYFWRSARRRDRRLVARDARRAGRGGPRRRLDARPRAGLRALLGGRRRSPRSCSRGSAARRRRSRGT